MVQSPSQGARGVSERLSASDRELGSPRGPASRPLPLREVRSEVLREILARLVLAPDLAAAASAVLACLPAFADLAVVQLLDPAIDGNDGGTPVPGAALWVHSPVRPVGDVPGHGFRPRRALAAGSILGDVMQSQRAAHRNPLDAQGLESVAADLDRALPDAARAGDELLVVPLLSGRVAIGALALLRRSGRPRFTGSDVETVEQMATVTALRLDNLRLAARQAATARVLAEALLPVVPRALTGVRVGVGYRAARREDRVGGDWLEAIGLPGGRTAFSVGDVMGHGTPAAVIMSMLRSAVQTMAPMHLDPAQLLRQLDDLAGQYQRARPDQPSWLATCLYAVYDPVTRECSIANAGHLPPVLTEPDGRSRLLDLEPGAPIGVGRVPFRTTRVVIPDGSQLTLYTDGLVEVRGQDIGEGMAALCRQVSAAARHPLERACRDLLDLAPVGERPDDVALLVARLHGLPRHEVAVWTLTADPDLAGHAGWLATRALERWGLRHLAPKVVPLLDELVANVVAHGAGPVTLRLLRGEDLLCEVSDTAGHLPTERAGSGGGHTGRGLRLLGSDTRRWGSYRTATGKVVWFECALAG